jgi:hypothetical protein
VVVVVWVPEETVAGAGAGAGGGGGGGDGLWGDWDPGSTGAGVGGLRQG